MSSGPESQSVQSNRRSFLAGLLAAGSAAVGALLAFPLVRFTLHPVLARTTEKSWSDVGSVDDRAARRLAQDGHRKARLRHERFQRRTDYPVGGLHPSRLHRSLGGKGKEIHLPLPSWRFRA